MGKSKKAIVLTLVSLMVGLASCTNPFAVSSNATSIDLTSLSEDEKSVYANGKDYFREVKNYSGYYSAPSTGTDRMLVVPVVFGDDSGDYSSDNAEGREILDTLDTAFFGTASSTNYWHSVASYYETSSYGNLKMTGTVADFYQLPNKVSYYENLNENSSSGSDGTDKIVASYMTDVIQNDQTYKVSDYDSDDDGIIDLLWFVYIYPYENNSSLLWAYTSWITSNATITLGASNYSWASYNFVNEGTSSGTDAHTYIHETGHQLGLDDYYSYDDLPHRSPLGGIDMMDYNIQDHNSFSKYDLGWITPTIGASGSSYELKPFQDGGDTLLLASNFNGTSFDEYFLVEYYTPTGLNTLDATTAYDDIVKGFTKSGVRILHIDQRLGKFNYNSKGEWVWDEHYYDNPVPSTAENDYFYTSVSSNTASYCLDDPSYCLASLVQASGKTNLLSKGSTASSVFATNSDLFNKTSLVFGSDVFTPSGKANEGWTLPYKLVINDMSTSSVTLTLEAV